MILKDFSAGGVFKLAPTGYMAGVLRDGKPHTNAGKMSCEVVISTQDEDRSGDVVITKVIDLSDHRRNPVALLNHDKDAPIGQFEQSAYRAGFIYGITGTTTALSGISWILAKDWPLNFGGKPHFALPAWIPITFEQTVLFSAVGMVLTFCYLCQIAPFVKKHHLHPRATDDLFVMVIECTDKTNVDDLRSFLHSNGAVETDVQVAETGWWLGRYDKDEMPFET